MRVLIIALLLATSIGCDSQNKKKHEIGNSSTITYDYDSNNWFLYYLLWNHMWNSPSQSSSFESYKSTDYSTKTSQQYKEPTEPEEKAIEPDHEEHFDVMKETTEPEGIGSEPSVTEEATSVSESTSTSE